MSVSRFPNPITTNFIPEAWDFTILNRFANFILTYPITQNADIVFQTVSVGTATLLTQMANTSYVYSAFLALLSAINIWSGSNTMTIGTSTVTAPIDMNYEPPTFLSTQRGYVVSTPITTGSINGASIATLPLTPGLWWIYFSVNTKIGFPSGSIVQVFDGATLLAQSFQNNLTSLFSTLKIVTTLSFDTGTKSITFPCGAGGGGMIYDGGSCFAVRMG